MMYPISTLMNFDLIENNTYVLLLIWVWYFAQEAAIQPVEAFMNDWCVRIVGKLCSSVAFNLHVVRHPLVSLHLPRLMHVEVLAFSIVYRQNVLVTCDYGKRDGAAPRTMHHPSPLNLKKSPYRPAGIHGRVKYCLCNDAKARRSWRAANWIISCCSLLSVCSCVLQIH